MCMGLCMGHGYVHGINFSHFLFSLLLLFSVYINITVFIL